MLTHAITPYKVPVRLKHEPESKRFKGEIGSDKHKEFILDRALQRCKYSPGEHVYYRGKNYQIISIYMDFKDVIWDGLSPLFVEIWDDTNGFWVVHPSVLKRTRK